MPSEHQHSQSHPHRPSLGGHQSTGSIHSQTDSPSSTPPHHGKTKPQKHVVSRGGHIHARVPSTKSMHTALKAHGKAGSHDNLKKLGRNASATHIKKNSSHVSLKRNQSSSDVGKRSKASPGHSNKKTSAVHFEIGDHDVEPDLEGEGEGEGEADDGDGWEEASSTASPALSRSASRPNSAKQSVSNSEPQSPQITSSFKPRAAASSTVAGTDVPVEREKEKDKRTADAKIITERLLQRTPSYNTTKMSLATATPAKATSSPRPLESTRDAADATATSNGTSQFGSKDEVISRFVSGSGTPRSQSFLQTPRNSSPSKSHRTHHSQTQDDIKRAQSMGNLTRRDSSQDSSQEESRPLAPVTRSRKSSTTNAYTPPHTQSRTQQKLWLQRASSNIEPQNLAPPSSLGITALGLGGYAHTQGGVTGLVGSGVGYDGRDPRIKAQLERTGLEYLVVRRHQDPVGVAVRRLERLPGAERYRRIPGGGKMKDREREREGGSVGRKGGLGLSQSLKESRKGGGTEGSGGAGSYGSHGDGESGRGEEDDGVSAILRSLWEKNFDLSSSAD